MSSGQPPKGVFAVWFALALLVSALVALGAAALDRGAGAALPAAILVGCAAFGGALTLLITVMRWCGIGG